MERETYRGETFWRLLGWTIFVLVMLWAYRSQAQEQYVRACQSSYACQLGTGVSWSAPIQTWVFTPIQPNVSLRIWVHNNNPTSAHTAQTITLWVTNSTTANTSLINQSDIWVQAFIEDNSTTGAKCLGVNANNAVTPGASGMATCYSNGMYAAQLAIQFNPGGAQAGVPDTFDIGVVQQPSVYASGPQPGTDAGAGNIDLTTVSGNNPAGNQLSATWSCTGIFNTCVPLVDIELLGVSRQERAVSAVGATTAGTGVVATQQFLSDGNTTTSSRAMSQSSTNAAPASGVALPGIQLTTSPATWTVPVQATTASACIASIAASATTRHCATGVNMCVSDTAAQTQLFVNLRDGATGAGTIKWNALLDGTAGTSSCVVHEFSGGPVCGTLNTAMTLELGAATAATNGCASTLRGYDIN
jgi:hypothetical protein